MCTYLNRKHWEQRQSYFSLPVQRHLYEYILYLGIYYYKMFDLIIGCSYGSELLVKEFREIAKKHISLGTALLEQIEMRE